MNTLYTALRALFFYACLLTLSSAYAETRPTLKFGLIEDHFFSSENDRNEATGLFVDAISFLTKHMDVAYTIDFLPDIKTLESEIAQGKLDIGISNIPNTTPSDTSLSYSFPIFITTLTLVTQSYWSDIMISFWSNLYQSGFASQLFLFFMIVLVFGFLFLLAEHKNNEAMEKRTLLGKFAICIYWSIGLISSIGSDVTPISNLGKVLNSTYCFLSIIVLTSLTGTFASMLTLQQTVSPSNLTTQSIKKLNLAVLDTTQNNEYIASLTKHAKRLTSQEEARDFLASNTQNAIIMSNVDSKIFTEYFNDSMYLERNLQGNIGYHSFILRADSPYKALLDKAIMKVTPSAAYATMIHNHMNS